MSEAKSFRQLAGIPPSTASTKDSVLVIIDAQNEYAKGALKIKNVDASRKVIKELLERYRADGGQVIHVLHQVSSASTRTSTTRTRLYLRMPAYHGSAALIFSWKSAA